MMSVRVRYENNENDALEVLNTAFIRLLKNLKDYDSQYPLLPWVRRITINIAIDRYRQKKRQRKLMECGGDDLESMSGNSHSIENEKWIESEYLKYLLRGLNESEKTVFNLFAIDGYAHKEIAEELGITERSSIRHLTQARRKLQEQITQSEIGTKKA
ncbi:MAG: sigma-70 family RNA polymerase sigma factor [Owenweeksia sp.]|nr:sigma-70 family RNA polymerase sigma factor [Owenweeksia sp.]